jgi:hypothetical protein
MPVIHYQSSTDRSGNRYQFAAKFTTSGSVLTVTDVHPVDYKIHTGFTDAIETVIVGTSSRSVELRHRELSACITAPKIAPLALKEFTESDYKNGLGSVSSTYMDRAATAHTYAIDLDASQNNGGRMTTVVQISIYTIGSKSAAVICITLGNGETVRSVGPKRLYANDALVASATLFLADPSYNLDLDSLSRADQVALILARSVNPNGRYATL